MVARVKPAAASKTRTPDTAKEQKPLPLGSAARMNSRVVLPSRWSRLPCGLPRIFCRL